MEHTHTHCLALASQHLTWRTSPRLGACPSSGRQPASSSSSFFFSTPASAGSGSLIDLCLDSLWLPGTLHHQYTSSSLASRVCACVCLRVCVCASSTVAAQRVSQLNHMVRLFPRVPPAWPISMVTSRRCGDIHTNTCTHARRHTHARTR